MLSCVQFTSLPTISQSTLSILGCILHFTGFLWFQLIPAQNKTPQYSLCLLSMSLHSGVTVLLRSPEGRRRLSQTAVFMFLWETATRELVGRIHIIYSSFIVRFLLFFLFFCWQHALKKM